jgi:transportin-3
MALQQLQNALEALYHHSDPKIKEEASHWLEEWQSSPEAWTITAQLLHSDAIGMEAQYFCSNTLRSKLERDFEELPPEAIPQLKQSLVQLLLKFSHGPPPVRTQLCLAMAALVAHLPSTEWIIRGNTDSFTTGGAVGWLTEQLTTNQPLEVSTQVMLELLLVLPEQSAGGHLSSVRPERRREVEEEMISAAPQAINILTSCLATSLSTAAEGSSLHRERTQERVLEAFAAWLRLCGPKFNVTMLTASSPLVQAALGGLQSSEIFFAAVDAVVEMVFVTSCRGRPRLEATQLVQILVPQVMSLKPRFHVCMQQAMADLRGGGADADALNNNNNNQGGGAWGDDGEEEAKGMARLFAEIGEAYTDLISTGEPAVAGPVVDALLDVASHPDDSICAMSFNFWHRLTMALTTGIHPQPVGFNGTGAGSTRSHPEDEPSPLPEEERRRRVAVFTPSYERLVALIRGRVKFPPDFDSWHREEKQDFKRGRVDIGDTLCDAADVLGGDKVLPLLVDPLLELNRQVASAGQQAFDWRTAEAALYCIRCIHDVAPPPGDALLLSLFQSLPGLPAPPPQLQYTMALTVSAYSTWLADTSRTALPPGQGAALLGDMLTMVGRGLGDEEASAAAALSIRRLVTGCAEILPAATIDTLFTLYNRIQGSGDIGADTANGLELSEKDVEELIEATTIAVSTLPVDQRRGYVQRMLDIVVQPIQQIIEQHRGVATAADAVAAGERLPIVLTLMNRITTIFKSVKDTEDLVEGVVRLWPWIEASLDRFGPDDTEAVETICKVPRYAIRNAGKAIAPVVNTIATALPGWFEKSGKSAFLFVASELIKTFGDDGRFDADLGPMFAAMMVRACSVLRTLEDVTNAPDIADDTFLLAGRGLSYAPRLVLVSGPLLPALLDAALAGVLVQHREASGSILSFFVRLCDPATHSKCPPQSLQDLQTALSPRIPFLVRLLLGGVAGAVPASRLADIRSVLFEILNVGGITGFEWVVKAVEAVPREAATVEEKRRFLASCQDVAMQGGGASFDDLGGRLLEAVDEFSDVCRRNRRSSQAAQRAFLPPELHYIIR